MENVEQEKHVYILCYFPFFSQKALNEAQSEFNQFLVSLYVLHIRIIL